MDGNLEDHLKLVVVSETIDAVQKVTMRNYHVTYYEIVETLAIDSTSIYKKIHDH